MAGSFTGNKAEAHPNTGVGDVTTSAFASPTTAGACIVVIIRNDHSNNWDVASVTDSASPSNTYTEVVKNVSSDPKMYIYRAKNIAGGTSGLTVTVHQASGDSRTFNWICAAEFTDVDTTEPVEDAGSRRNEPSGTSVMLTDADVDSSAAGGVFVGGDSCPAFTTYTAGSVGGTAATLLYGNLGDSGGQDFGGAEYALLSGTLSGAQGSMTVSPNQAAHCFVWCVLKGAAGGPHEETIIGSGGVVVSGAATITANHTAATVGAGGLRTTGTAGMLRGRVLVASSGVRVSGAAGVISGGLQSVAIVGAGGVLTSGAAVVTAGHTVTIVGAGGLAVGTGTTVVRGVAIRGAGGTRTSGVGTVLRLRGVVGLGGLRASGAAGLVMITGATTPPDVIVRVGADDVVIRMPADDTRVLT